MTPAQAATLARIEERGIHTKESLDIHIEDDGVRFERTFNYVKDAFSKMDERFDTIDTKLGTLWDNNNRQEGAFGLGKWMAGLIGGAVVAGAEFLRNMHGGNRP